MPSLFSEQADVMSKRRLKWVIVLLTLVPVSFVVWAVFNLVYEGWSQRQWITLSILWGAEGEGIDTEATSARTRSRDSEAKQGHQPYLPWDEWPTKCQEQVRWCGLTETDTERLEGLILTTFRSPERPGVRWFYIIPERLIGEEPWYLVGGGDSRALVYRIRPGDGGKSLCWLSSDEDSKAAVLRICQELRE